MTHELNPQHAEEKQRSRNFIHEFHKRIGSWIFTAAETMDMIESKPEEEAIHETAN